MDLNQVARSAGTNVTHTIYNADHNTTRSHQITRADFATTYAWGTDIDMDGFGMTGLRHINGNIVFATEFKNGNDAQAVQAAVNWVNATSPGQGVVIIPAINGQWDWDTQVDLHDGVQIVGMGSPEILVDNVNMFRLGAGGIGADDVSISGLTVEGKASNTSLLVSTTASSRIRVFNNVVGIGADNNQHLGGYLVSLAGTNQVYNDIMVFNNWMPGSMHLCTITTGTGGGDNILIANNYAHTPAASSGGGGSNHFIYLENLDAVSIQGNRCIHDPGGTTTYSPPSHIVWLDRCQTTSVSGNYFLGSSDHMVRITDCKNVVIEGNTILGAGYDANNGNATTDDDGIHLESPGGAGVCEGIWVVGNVSTRPLDGSFPGGSDSTVYHRYGCYVSDSDTHGVYIIDNFFENIGAGATSTNNHVCGDGNGSAGSRTGAGYRTESTTRITRRGNVVIADQTKERVALTQSGSDEEVGVEMNGIRTPAADADRNAQYVTVFVQVEETSAAPGNGAPALASPFAQAANEVEIQFTAAYVTNDRVSMELIT